MLLSKATYGSPWWETILFSGLSHHFHIHMEVLKSSFLVFTITTQKLRLIALRQALPELAGSCAFTGFWLNEFQLTSCSEALASCILWSSEFLSLVCDNTNLSRAWSLVVQSLHVSRSKLHSSKYWMTAWGCCFIQVLDTYISQDNSHRPYSDDLSLWPCWLLSKMGTIRPRKLKLRDLKQMINYGGKI